MATPQWVKLHLVPQTEGTNTMPPYVVGLLTGDSPAHYVLNPMLEVQPDENTQELMFVPVGMNFISRVYVWRCQMLAEKPDSDFLNADNQEYEDTSGGLG
jgi:hypothetical protein